MSVSSVRSAGRAWVLALAAALASAWMLLSAQEARADDGGVLDDARQPFMPEFHAGIDLHQTSMPSAISLCTPAGRNACPTVRTLGQSEYGGGKVTHAAFDAGFDFLGVGPLRLGVGMFVGFGDGPSGMIGGDPGAPGTGLQSSSSWRAYGVYGIIALRFKGNGWAGYMELMPGAVEMQADVTGSYPALRTDTTVGMMGSRIGFTVPISRMFAMGPSFGMGTQFNGDAPITDINGGIRLEVRLNQLFDETKEERGAREAKQREERLARDERERQRRQLDLETRRVLAESERTLEEIDRTLKTPLAPP